MLLSLERPPRRGTDRQTRGRSDKRGGPPPRAGRALAARRIANAHSAGLARPGHEWRPGRPRFHTGRIHGSRALHALPSLGVHRTRLVRAGALRGRLQTQWPRLAHSQDSSGCLPCRAAWREPRASARRVACGGETGVDASAVSTKQGAQLFWVTWWKTLTRRRRRVTEDGSTGANA